MRMNAVSGVMQVQKNGRAMRRLLPTITGIVTLILVASPLRADEINYVLADDGVTATLTLQDYTPGPASPLSNANFVSFNVIGSVNGGAFDYTVDEGQLKGLSGVIDPSGETLDVIDLTTVLIPNSLGGALPDMSGFTENFPEMDDEFDVLTPLVCMPGEDCRGMGKEIPILKKQLLPADSWAAVPEPGSMSLILLGLIACLIPLPISRARRKGLRV